MKEEGSTVYVLVGVEVVYVGTLVPDFGGDLEGVQAVPDRSDVSNCLEPATRQSAPVVG